MTNLTKGLLIALIAMYIVSPVDLCPGPIDDMIIMLLGIAGSKKLNQKMEVKQITE